jgi:succinate dehydrogenase / fumarate reductase cytochrome b subunit
MKYAYFPGCVALDSCKELDLATREVAKDLRIELVDLDEAACCGAGNLQEKNPEAALVLNARTLAMAQEKGLDLLTVCGSCQLYLARAREELENPNTRERVNRTLAKAGRRYDGGTKVKHLLQVLLEDVGPRKLAAHVRRPLGDLAVGAFYGCHLLRAPGTERFENPEDPQGIETLVTLLGGHPIAYSGRTACCGFHVLTVRRDLAVRMSAAGLSEAKTAGASVLATPCPLCHIVLDMYQKKASKEAGESLNMPVLHLSQLVGLALGIDPRRLGVARHLVSVKPVTRVLEDEEVVKA